MESNHQKITKSPKKSGEKKFIGKCKILKFLFLGNIFGDLVKTAGRTMYYYFSFLVIKKKIIEKKGLLPAVLLSPKKHRVFKAIFKTWG